MKRLSLSLALLATAPLARADVLVVDAAGGGDFTSLRAAVTASADGDTLLIEPGFYLDSQGPIATGDRSLVIAYAGPGQAVVEPLQVLPTTAGKRVVLRNLDLHANDFAGISLQVQGAEVHAEGCSFAGLSGDFVSWGSGNPGIWVGPSTRLVLKDCSTEGGHALPGFDISGYDPTFPAAAIQVNGIASAVAIEIHGGTVQGGFGGNDDGSFLSFSTKGTPGGPGVLMPNGGSIFIAGASVSGGPGGSGSGGGGGAGGPGVSFGQPGVLHHLDAAIAGGAGGADGVGGPTGAAGQAIQQSGGPSTVVAFAGDDRSLGSSAVTPEGGSLQYAYAGVQGDLLGLFLSTASGATLLPGKQGIFSLGAPLVGPVLLGPVTEGDGTLALAFTVPNLGFGPEDALLVNQQAFVKPVGGATLLSSPTAAVFVDDSL
ncbi:MAG TPA: hypothetical protein VFY71_02925 [Planctomycetota bacterium]|nr:hypothetical protein [Planctomycetota bacterium]